jgi:type I restriction enzyme R subunit
MQTLARVNRTFRGKEDGLLVAYAPLAENLAKALAEYTAADQKGKPLGRDISDAVELATTLVETLRGLVAGFDWKTVLAKGGPRAYLNAVVGTVNYLRSPATPGNQYVEGQETTAAKYRRYSGQLSRAWALCSGSDALAALRPEVQVYEEVRVWMAKYDAADRKANGEPIPEDIARLLGELIASATASGEVLDIYAAAGMPKLSLADLTPEFLAKTQHDDNPQLAIEALRALLTEEMVASTRNNVIRERAFSARIAELMNKYTNQQLTSAQVMAELVAMAAEIAEESNRGLHFTPPLSSDELAFYDAVVQNDSAVDVQGEGILANIARQLVEVMRRDVRTDWTVRDDVRAKLRSSIKRLLIINGYPPDKQPEAIKLVMEQMESMAPRYALERG